MKNFARALLLVVIVAVAALVLYVSFAGNRAKPQPNGEFPTEQTPAPT
ncbi:MAG TPA: hypothetical protein VMH22_00370 [bacterium]|nr:hypothetical protein [bacterium]